MLDRYLGQIRLLLGILPGIAQETAFALKGGTAINLFYRDLPRLSVDLDLTWLPVTDRRSSLRDIDHALDRIAMAVAARDPRIQARRIAGGGGADTRVMVRDDRAQVKIETSPVARGTVYPARSMPTSDAVTERFGFFEANVVAFEDLYGGKLHAALDRRHPRDLFDVKLLYENEGMTDDLFRAFLVYVASSARPIHELLAPQTRLRKDLYDGEFVGMTRQAVSLEALADAARTLHADIRSRLHGDVADFLLSLHDAEPDFRLLSLPGAADLPAVRWKVANLNKLRDTNPAKHAAQRGALERLCR